MSAPGGARRGAAGRAEDASAVAAAFDAVPDLGPFLAPGAQDYADRCLREARTAAARVPVAMNLAYGDDPFQRLDVWGVPRNAGGDGGGADTPPRPVLVYWHGGALLNGHKEWIGLMAPAVTALGAILVSPNYRLVPRVSMPGPLEDARAALAWVAREIARFGGDPGCIALGGHSAGGFLAALAALDAEGLAAHGVDPASLRACLPLSGFFELKRGAFPPDTFRDRHWRAMARDDATAARCSASTHVSRCALPFFLAWGERDMPELLPENAWMARRLAEHGCLLGRHVLPGTDHFEAHFASVAPGSPWMEALRGVLAAR